MRERQRNGPQEAQSKDSENGHLLRVCGAHCAGSVLLHPSWDLRSVSDLLKATQPGRGSIWVGSLAFLFLFFRFWVTMGLQIYFKNYFNIMVKRIYLAILVISKYTVQGL